MDEILLKEKIEELKEYGQKKEYIPLSKIIEVVGDDGEEILDDVIKELENDGYEVYRDSEDVPSEEDLLIGKVDDDFEAFIDEVEMDEEFSELATSVENEIKVSDFDDIVSTSHQADDPVRMYLRDIGQIELLNVNQESEYARTVQEGIMAKEKIDQYKRLGRHISDEELAILNNLHTFRIDESSYLKRSSKSRGVVIKPNNTSSIKPYMVTIDNELYKRYTGEVSIALKEMDNKGFVNVVGYVCEEAHTLIDLIKPGSRLKFKICGFIGE